MKVKELIEKLQTFDQDLVVAIADWSEQYTAPCDDPLKDIYVQRVARWNEEILSFELVTRLVIGNYDDKDSWTDGSFKGAYKDGVISS